MKYTYDEWYKGVRQHYWDTYGAEKQGPGANAVRAEIDSLEEQIKSLASKAHELRQVLFTKCKHPKKQVFLVDDYEHDTLGNGAGTTTYVKCGVCNQTLHKEYKGRGW